MRRLLSVVLAGAACGLAAGVLSLVFELAMLAVRARAVMPSDSSGGLGAVSAPVYAPVVAVFGCVVGAGWSWRRVSKREAIAKVR